MRRPRRKCTVCRSWFRPRRSDGRFCKAACRQQAYRARRDPHRWRASANECAYDHEHEKAFADDPDWKYNKDAAAWQYAEAMRLAKEYALLRPGTRAQDINRARIAEARGVADAWKRLAAELRRVRRSR